VIMLAKNWYPIIDKEKCIQCYQCVNFCSHDVYEVGQDGYPNVKNPDNCVEFCRGCQKICPNEAIKYFGEER